VAGGSYGSVALSGRRTGDVVVRPADGASVTLAGLTIGPDASHFDLRGFVVNDTILMPDGGATDIVLHGNDAPGITVGAGANNIVIDHNDLHGAWYGVLFSSGDCTVPGAPTWPGCVPEDPISNVTINGNRFTGPFGEDAMQIKNFRNVVVTNNEITQVREDGNHNDCLQTVFGGDGLVYRGNYQHDNRCQGIFLKDGLVTNVVVEDNLFVRNNLPCLNKICSNGGPLTVSFFDTHGLTLRNNVVWDNQGGTMLRTGTTGVKLDHNVIESFAVESLTPYVNNPSNLTEDYNVFGDARNWRSYIGPHTVVQPSPSFRSPSTADYRLSGPLSQGGATFSAGVTWRPADKHFGP